MELNHPLNYFDNIWTLEDGMEETMTFAHWLIANLWLPWVLQEADGVLLAIDICDILIKLE